MSITLKFAKLSPAALVFSLFLCLGLDVNSANADPEKTSQLIALLQSDADVAKKADACRQLGEFGTAEAIPPLAALLDDKVLATYARSGLERIRDPAAATALREALATIQAPRLVGVISSLAAIRDTDAVDKLKELADHKNAAVTKAALLALGRIADDRSLVFVRKSLEAGNKDAPAACLLAAQTREQSGDIATARALYDEVRLADVPLPYRIGATRGAIIAREGKEQVALLVEQLNSEDRAIRNVALLTIRAIPSELLADAIHAKLKSATPDLRVQLIAALQDCHNAKSFAVVRSLLEHEGVNTRMAAINAVNHVRGENAGIASALLEAVIARRTTKETENAIALLSSLEGNNVDAIAVSELASTDDDSLRIDLIGLLGSRRSQFSLVELMNQAKAKNEKVRIAAFRALKGIAGPSDVTRLMGLLEATEDEAGRATASSLIISLSNADVLKHLILERFKTTTSAADRATWTQVLISLGYPKALPEIMDSLKSEDEDVVSETISQLGRWPDPSPVDDLLVITADHPNDSIRSTALSSAIQLINSAAEQNQRPTDSLIAWLQTANGSIATVSEKRRILSAMGKIADARIPDLLKPYLIDKEVTTEAAYAVVGVAQRLAKGGDQSAAKAAVEMIKDIKDEGIQKQIRQIRRDLK